MQSFAYHSPTKLHFGVGVGAVVDHMADELTSSGCKTALVVTGGGSVRRNGELDAVLKALEAAGKLQAFVSSSFQGSIRA